MEEVIESGRKEEDETTGGTLATLLGAPRYHPFRICGVMHGQKITMLVDSCATHNFIDEGLIVKRGLVT